MVVVLCGMEARTRNCKCAREIPFGLEGAVSKRILYIGLLHNPLSIPSPDSDAKTAEAVGGNCSVLHSPIFHQRSGETESAPSHKDTCYKGLFLSCRASFRV